MYVCVLWYFWKTYYAPYLYSRVLTCLLKSSVPLFTNRPNYKIKLDIEDFDDIIIIST